MNLIYSKRKELKTVLLCTFIYLFIFLILEKISFNKYLYTETFIDEYIPFLEIFVIPYLLWFPYIIFGFIFFILYDTKGFYRTCFYLFGGMYVCLFIYMIFPNAQGLRVSLDANSFLQNLLSFVYNVDTSTNVCPSIHVYNSIMMYVSLMKNELFKSNKFIVNLTGILTISICLSTIFTKQHAFIDGVFSIPLCLIFYQLYKNKEYFKLTYNILKYKAKNKLKISTN